MNHFFLIDFDSFKSQYILNEMISEILIRRNGMQHSPLYK